jgi:hypothetical protein
MGMYTLRINFGKNELGYLLGEFFTNSSGHPGHKWTIGKVPKKQKKKNVRTSGHNFNAKFALFCQALKTPFILN